MLLSAQPPLKRGSVRKSIALILSAGLLVGLSACASTTATLTEGDCTPATDPGSSSESVTVSGDASTPTYDFPTPVFAKRAERSVLEPGSGPAAEKGSVVLASYTAVGGAGQGQAQPKQFSATLTDDSPALPKEIVDSLTCSRAGERIAVVLPDAQAADGSANVFVFDITGVYSGRASGSNEPAEAGFPSVVTAPDGRPGLTFASGPTPTELRSTTLIKGSGDVVADSDLLIVQKTGVIWGADSTFESTWADGSAAGITLSSQATPEQGGVVPGLRSALIGQTVGSQVLVVVPPADGFGDAGSTKPAVAPGSTVVYVVDILGKLPAQ
ncbi:FKBP-type peptidyl-prolyl cis-trans isomerase [Agreia sp. VKM Ac-1783]|nr:FKBP-type peptidyl-prolyl cis-trans isomerase [Agreia sp. VKM Ac-1783]